MNIDADFDGGNIEVISASDRGDIRLSIVPDPEPISPGDSDRFLQWFHFRVTGAADRPLVFRIVNAGKAAFPEGWADYRCVVSNDGTSWLRTDTTWDPEAGELVIRHTPTGATAWYAYFAPYPLARHEQLLRRSAANPAVTRHILGSTVDGRPLEMLRYGTGPLNLWLLARQHPGESMAAWWMEGFLQRLLDQDDRVCWALASLATFHVVPNMNPDGSTRGHLRVNAAGANLNREWGNPRADVSPEVYLVRAEMDRTGVDFCLDVHGDEGLPYNFISGAEGIPSWTDRLATLQAKFLEYLTLADPQFQTTHGYPIDAPGEGNMDMCTHQVAERFDCLSMTLEMPFKDNADDPDPKEGWSPLRSMILGGACIDALAAVIGDLRPQTGAEPRAGSPR